MLDFAASLLGEIERWMLMASPAMIDLNTFADTSDKFQGASSLLNDMQKRFPASVDEASALVWLWPQAPGGFVVILSLDPYVINILTRQVLESEVILPQGRKVLT